MGIISEYVEIGMCPQNIKRYGELGYKLQMHEVNGVSRVDRSKKILVKASDLPNKSEVKVTVRCDCCDEVYNVEYYRYLYAIERYQGFTYCQKCIAKLFHSGENHPNYNPNLDRTSRNTAEYGQFVRNVLIRDNFTCIRCGKYDTENSEVHHLNGYCWDVENRLNINNGVTLCANCHGEFHSIYGVRHSTKEQFLEWLNINELRFPEYVPDNHKSREVFCYEDQKRYSSVKQICEMYGLSTSSQLYAVCNHRKRYNTFKGKHWFWHDEYINMTEEEILYYVNK